MAGRATQGAGQQNTQRLCLPSGSPSPRTHHCTTPKEMAGNLGLQRPHQPAYSSKATSEWPGQQCPEPTPWHFWATSFSEQPWGHLLFRLAWWVGTEACAGPVRVCRHTTSQRGNQRSQVDLGAGGALQDPKLSHSLRSSKGTGRLCVLLSKFVHRTCWFLKVRVVAPFERCEN